MNRLDERLKERARREDWPNSTGFDGAWTPFWRGCRRDGESPAPAVSAGGR